MKLLLLLMLLLPLVRESARAQEDGEEHMLRRRQELIHQILRIQDIRSPNDRRLVAALSDTDATIRERALLAFGSLQDTTRLDLLLAALTDPAPRVQTAAAFAIGQTATALSERGRRSLEDDILRNRIGDTGVNAQLIEEIGKFGTAVGLHQMLLRYAPATPALYPEAICMSIGRFALRGITSEESVSYLLRVIRPTDRASWQSVYALHRTGDFPQIRADLSTLLLLRHHTDPLVRLNLAGLLGKLRDEPSAFDALLRMAEFDLDWRVRVNSIRSLCTYDLRNQPAALRTLQRAIVDSNSLVALSTVAALTSLTLSLHDTSDAPTGIREALEQIALNTDRRYPWQLQGESAMALARLLGGDAIRMLPPDPGTSPYLSAQLLKAGALTGSPNVLRNLQQASEGFNPITASAALEGLGILLTGNPDDRHLHQEVYQTTLRALTRKNVAIVATAAGLLGDTLLRSRESVGPLLERLKGLRVPDDIEAFQEITRVLGLLRDSSAVPPLVSLLSFPDRTVALSASQALQAITGTDYASQIPPRAEPIHTDFDFETLDGFPEPIVVRIETGSGTIRAELNRSAAPFTVLSFIRLAGERGFYDGTTFHRVVPNFVVQGGDPEGDGWGGPGYTIRSEFSPLRFDTGVLGMASAGKDTEGSQFFITHSPQPHLEGRYTIFGKVISGQEVVDRLLVGDRILRIRVSE